jgi:uncharacterized protein YuzE
MKAGVEAMTEMQLTFDRRANAAYTYIEASETTPPAKQILIEDSSVRGMVIIDVNAKGRMLGIKVLGAAKALPYELLEKA